MTAPVAADDPRTAGSAAAAGAPVIVADGVRLQRVRDGQCDEALFIVPGLEGDATELTQLVAALVGPQPVYALAPLGEDAQGQPVSGMQRMAELLVAAVRQVQPEGPYRIGGYSFGALLALEMAQQLKASGAEVEALFLIEAIYDERYWPRGIWLRALVRRTLRQLGQIIRMRPGAAIGEFRRRGVRLVQRLMRRNNAAAAGAADPLHAAMAAEASAFARANIAISAYRPYRYDGALTLIASSMDRHFGCDTVQLWPHLATDLVIERVEGDHLTVMHEAASAAAVASIIDHQLAMSRPGWPGVRPLPGYQRPMILTTMAWFSAARLAHALVEAGFTVSACRPRHHVLESIEGLTGQYRLNRLARASSLLRAIRAARPDIILPDDERALALLRRLHARIVRTDPAVAAVIAHSLGNREDWPSIVSRTALAEEAHVAHIPAPATAVIPDAAALATWVDAHGLPMALKTDGSWGGRGVAIVREPGQLAPAWRSLSNPPGLPRAMKRLLFDRETGPISAWIRRARPVVNAQAYVAGREAIVTAACHEGVVSALVCLEVVQASEARGPAAVVRIIDHPGMAEAARALVKRFGLSGFCGFDFILDEDGEAQLLEINPRVTPTSYLLVEGEFQSLRTLALFPADHPTGATGAVLDRPVRVPALVARGEAMLARKRRLGRRVTRWLSRNLSGRPA